MKKILIFVFSFILVSCAIYFLFGNNNGNQLQLKFIEVKKGTISEKALAVGTIEPDKEIKVKSAISGIISNVYFKIGDFVEKGKPLFEISPNPTPLEYVQAQRNMEIAQVNLNQIMSNQKRKKELYNDKLISSADMDDINSLLSEANLKYKIAREKFQLLEKGMIKTSKRNIDSIIKSPITGIILSKNVYVGDPVVPLTNFQPGTELCAMADMQNMLFKGTVDEIDVGKLEPGMKADIQVGALPQTKIEGKLERISPKAKKDGNATIFDIEILVEKINGKSLRAGYSATSYIKIQEREDVLVIPERLVIMEKEKKYVEIKEGDQIVKKEIKTGLSDSMNIEITEGLKLGQNIIERPPREIE